MNGASEALRVVMVGHLDHGKSTLIGRLLHDTGSLAAGRIEQVERVCAELGRGFELAYLVDNFREERENEMTVDTTQVFFRNGNRRYVLIDAPGHLHLLKNMVTGASQADAAVLVVDATEGVKAQTRRHVQLLSIMGLKQVVVAINKMDAVRFKVARFAEVEKALRGFFDSVGLTATRYVPISAALGDNVVERSLNMDWCLVPPCWRHWTRSTRTGTPAWPLSATRSRMCTTWRARRYTWGASRAGR